MSLIKWLRKNNKKIMAVVVIVIMFGFIGGSYLSYLGQRSSPLHSAVAHYLDNRKITNYDVQIAQNELELLKSVAADELMRGQDVHGLLLAELLFAGERTSPELIAYLRQAITANQYRISNSQIGKIYQRAMPPSLYWLLLKEEAHNAGVRVSNADAGEVLSRAIPKLLNGATYGQLMGSMMQRGTAEGQVLKAFADLLAVFQYARFISSCENVTVGQMAQAAWFDRETIDVNFVKFDAEQFLEAVPEPNEKQVNEHFAKYKTYFAGDVTDENPFGFGYKLPERVQLEYLVLKVSDVKSIVKTPTFEETEEYYQKNREQFTKKVPGDPNDPNSLLVGKVSSYAEAAAAISDRLLQKKVDAKIQAIMQEAKSAAQGELETTDTRSKKLTSEQIKSMVGDFKKIAEQLSAKHNIKIWMGTTGLLSAGDLQSDKRLGSLTVQSAGYHPIYLTQIVFAVDELAASELGPFDVPKPRMYETIGPARNQLPQTLGSLRSLFDEVAALVRVVRAGKAVEPNNIDVAFSKAAMVLDANQASAEVHSVRQTVVEDLKKLGAMDGTMAKAREFLQVTKDEGWQKAAEKFSALYSRKADQQPADSNAFRIQNLTALRRISAERLAAIAAQSYGHPMARSLAHQARRDKLFIQRLYELVPADGNTVKDVAVPLEFKPGMSFLCIKDISINRLWKEDFERSKPMEAFRLDETQSQSLAVVHFNPENIVKRLKFRWVSQDREPSDANIPAEPAETNAVESSADRSAESQKSEAKS
jgi:hypothetical protein